MVIGFSRKTSLDKPSTWVNLIRRVFGQYLDADHQFSLVLEEATKKGWPDKANELRSKFRLLYLYQERQRLRLDFILDRSPSDKVWMSYTTIDQIWKRVEEHWTAAEEEELLASNQAYSLIQREVGSIQATLDVEQLKGSFDMAKRDPVVQRAVSAFIATHRSLDKELASQS